MVREIRATELGREPRMSRTIVDILHKGNLELFHSAMISWMLDPHAEHCLGTSFLERFAEKVPDRNVTEIISAVRAGTPVTVGTESTSYRSRYDIEIRCDRNHIVLENKTKSIGETSQLEGYATEGTLLVALGFSEVSFSEDLGIPLVKYRDVLDVLNNLFIPSNDFGVLIKHYRTYLERELGLLDLIFERYAQGHGSSRTSIIETIKAVEYTKNDLRFLNLYLLEQFRRMRLAKGAQWRGATWRTNKNEQSGVWLASSGELPKSYSFSPEIEQLCCESSARLWFHVEIRSDFFVLESKGRVAGEIQLRCQTESDNAEFADKFKDLHREENQGYRVRNKPHKGHKTFYLVKRNLLEEDLEFGELETRLICFYESFGTFSLDSRFRNSAM